MSDDGGIERGRTLSRPAERELVRVVAVLIALVALSYVLDIFISFDITFYKEQFFGLLYGLVFAGGFLVFPATKGAPRDRIALYDYVLASLGLAIGLYVFIAYPAIVLTAGIITPFKTALGAIAVLIILELTRRIFSWPPSSSSTPSSTICCPARSAAGARTGRASPSISTSIPTACSA